MSIKFIEIYVKTSDILTDNLNLKLEIQGIKDKLESHDKNIELVFTYLDKLMEKQENPKLEIQLALKRIVNNYPRE